MQALESSSRVIRLESLLKTLVEGSDGRDPLRGLESQSLRAVSLFDELVEGLRFHQIEIEEGGLYHCVFRFGQWIAVDLRTVDFNDVVFEKQFFSKTDFSSCSFRKTEFLHCVFSDCLFPQSDEISFVGCMHVEQESETATVELAQTETEPKPGRPPEKKTPSSDRFDGLER